MPPDPAAPPRFDLAEFRDGAVDLAPALIAQIPIGLLYGAVAVSKGLSPLEVVLMSGLVFAGGLQLAAIEMWTAPVPVLALALSAFLINARYLLMGASLAPKIAHLPRRTKFLGLYVLADENWALAERRAAHRPITAAYFFGMGALFWIGWVGWTALGVALGPLLGDPARLGADFAFTAIFIGLVAGFLSTMRAGAVVIAAAAGATLAHLALGSPWHVLAGAFCGIAAGAALFRPDAAEARA